jgi:hypothetical protein
MKMKPMNIRQLACAFLFSCLAAGVGYYAGALRQDTARFTSPGTKFSVDDLYRPQSFSEVENAKALMSALSEQFVTGIQAERVANYANAVLISQTGETVVEPHLLEVSKQLERGVAEFKGTEQELVLIEQLLEVLKKANLHAQWTEVYLNALYQHPTHPMIGRLATEAVTVSKAAGRQNDVLNGFEHVSSIPMDFGVKAQLMTVLFHARSAGLVAAR